MKPAATHPQRHRLRLCFNDTPQDQALYEALVLTSEKEYRPQLPRHAKYLLAMALGLRRVDLNMLKRIGVSTVDHDDLFAEATAEALAAIGPRKERPKLRLV